jgi:hypothetical protein
MKPSSDTDIIQMIFLIVVPSDRLIYPADGIHSATLSGCRISATAIPRSLNAVAWRNYDRLEFLTR